MNSKYIYCLTTAIICIIILVHCTSSQPLTSTPEKVDNSLWISSSSDSEANDMDDSMSKLFLLHRELNHLHEPVRRANFWKRANFWRKRANFW